jgi:hypothetical protein
VTRLTRRSLLHQTPISAAAFSLLPAMPAVAGNPASPAAAPKLSAGSAGSMIVHVNNVATGEMTLLVGARQISLRDPRIVAFFLEATGNGASAAARLKD